MVRKKKRIRKDRVIIVCVLALVICFGIYKGASWMIHTISSLLEPEVQQEVVQEKEEEKVKEYIATVVLDAGHGDWDPGANVNDVLEKDITLTTAVIAKLTMIPTITVLICNFVLHFSHNA